jgi:hypothetical protein
MHQKKVCHLQLAVRITVYILGKNSQYEQKNASKEKKYIVQAKMHEKKCKISQLKK